MREFLAAVHVFYAEWEEWTQTDMSRRRIDALPRFMYSDIEDASFAAFIMHAPQARLVGLLGGYLEGALGKSIPLRQRCFSSACREAERPSRFYRQVCDGLRNRERKGYKLLCEIKDQFDLRVGVSILPSADFTTRWEDPPPYDDQVTILAGLWYCILTRALFTQKCIHEIHRDPPHYEFLGNASHALHMAMHFTPPHPDIQKARDTGLAEKAEAPRYVVHAPIIVPDAGGEEVSPLCAEYIPMADEHGEHALSHARERELSKYKEMAQSNISLYCERVTDSNILKLKSYTDDIDFHKISIRRLNTALVSLGKPRLNRIGNAAADSTDAGLDRGEHVERILATSEYSHSVYKTAHQIVVQSMKKWEDYPEIINVEAMSTWTDKHRSALQDALDSETAVRLLTMGSTYSTLDRIMDLRIESPDVVETLMAIMPDIRTLSTLNLAYDHVFTEIVRKARITTEWADVIARVVQILRAKREDLTKETDRALRVFTKALDKHSRVACTLKSAITSVKSTKSTKSTKSRPKKKNKNRKKKGRSK